MKKTIYFLTLLGIMFFSSSFANSYSNETFSDNECNETSNTVDVQDACLCEATIFQDYVFGVDIGDCSYYLYVIPTTDCSKEDITNEYYTFDWGEGAGPEYSVSSGMSHQFTASGTYSVQIVYRVTDLNGCTSIYIINKTITVECECLCEVANSGIESIGNGCSYFFSVLIDANCEESEMDNESLVYEYGDGQTGNIPYHTYSNSGIYEVTATYTITDINGCVSSVSSSVTIVVNCQTCTCNPYFSNVTFAYSTACDISIFVLDSNTGCNPSSNFKSKSYIFDFGDGSNFQSSSPSATHSYSSPGSYYVTTTYKVTDIFDCTSVYVSTKLVQVDCEPKDKEPLQWDNKSNEFDNNLIPSENSIKISPNPTNGEISIEINTHFDGDTNIEIYDITGKLVQSIIKNVTATKPSTFTQDISHLKKGVYMVVFRTDVNAAYEKLIIN